MLRGTNQNVGNAWKVFEKTRADKECQAIKLAQDVHIMCG